MNDEPENNGQLDGQETLVDKVTSPLKFFALVVLVCNTIFGAVAALSKQYDIFVFSIHMFLGIVGAFILMAIWAPRSLYHPQDLRNVEHLLPEHDNPKVVTWILGVALVGYVAYRIYIYHRFGLPT